MIAIINQHKGDFNELHQHLINYFDRLKCDKFHMILRLDGISMSTEEYEILSEFDKKPGLSIICDSPQVCDGICTFKNIGLTPSRLQCWTLAKGMFELDLEGILLGCTNSKWTVDLNRDLYERFLTDLKNSEVTLIRCKYKEDKVHPFDSRLSIPVKEYLTDMEKPDYTLLLNPYLKLYTFESEKYTPEELTIMDLGMNSNLHQHYGPFPIMEAWYNDTGLTKSFNRQFVLDNRKGFLERAKRHLREFVSDNLPLTQDLLKRYVADYVTLSESFDFDEFKGTVIEPLLFWTMARWVNNKDFNHKLKFIE